MPKLILFANTDWYLYNFRRSLALAAQSSGYEVLLVSPPGEYGERLRHLGLRWQPLPRMDRRSLNPLRELRLLLSLVVLFRHERPALVHGFTIKCAVYGSLAAQLAHVPARVNAVAGLGYVFASSDRRARWLRPMVRAMLHLALRGRRTRLILQNPDDQMMFQQSGLIELDRVDLIPGSGVDCVRFSPCADEGSTPRQHPCVLLAARLLWDKGVGEYVEAARLLRSAGRNVSFLLAGTPDPGNPAAVPESTLQQWADEGVIEWLGQIDDTSELFRSVDIVALPTYYREGLPKSLIEAAACALPLVTTDMPGCREVVTNEVDGLLIPPHDAGALAQAIARLIDSPKLAARLGAAARLKALANFDERLVIERTLAVYRELL
jgi:glycosyltransferase involved in cell wall biosynthesis